MYILFIFVKSLKLKYEGKYPRILQAPFMNKLAKLDINNYIFLTLINLSLFSVFFNFFFFYKFI